MTGQKMSMSISGRGSDIGWADDFVFAPQSPQSPQSRLGPSAVVSAGFRYRGEGFGIGGRVSSGFSGFLELIAG